LNTSHDDLVGRVGALETSKTGSSEEALKILNAEEKAIQNVEAEISTSRQALEDSIKSKLGSLSSKNEAAIVSVGNDITSL
jgi:hypothetical protein